MTEHPTTSWEALQDGNVFYKRHRNYTIPRKLPDLGEHIVAGCRYGGPIGMYGATSYSESCIHVICSALMRDTTKLIALGRGNTVFAKAQIQIQRYSCKWEVDGEKHTDLDSCINTFQR